MRLARSGLIRAEAARSGGDVDEAQRWLERCHRLLPDDPYICLQLALIALGRDNARSESLFARIAADHDRRDVWLGLAAARLGQNDPSGAAAALATALSRHTIGPQTADVAAPIVQMSGAIGWCGLAPDGGLAITLAGAGAVEVRLDGRRVDQASLPRAWTKSRALAMTADGRHLLGSPIDLAAIRRIDGYVEAHAGGIRGWAWYPADPETDPVLALSDASGRRVRRITASTLEPPLTDAGLLGRQRRFEVAADQLRHVSGPVHIRGRDGQDLLGSPLQPWLEQAAATAAAAAIAWLYPTGSRPRRPLPTAMPPAIPTGAPAPWHAPAARPRHRTADVAIPVYNNTAMALACIESVLASLPPPGRLMVIDDASTDPALIEALDTLAKCRRIRLIRHARNLGFPAAANAGIAASAGRDVVLLHSDTQVPPGWLERLHAAAYNAPNIGTVTPLTNNATIVHWPGVGGRMPDRAQTLRLDRVAKRASQGVAIDIPVGDGFCLYLRRDCLASVGLLRADLFAQGHGEATDFCLRARHLGWRHVALPGLFVAHGGASRGGHGDGKPGDAAGRYLQVRNEALLRRLHPGYAEMIEALVTADPLGEARRRLDLERWRGARRRGGDAVILITHSDGGGVEQRIAASVASHRSAGMRAIVLRPARFPDGRNAIEVCDGAMRDYPDLRFAMPDEMPALLRLLRGDRPQAIEVHHFLGHDPSVYQLLRIFALPFDVHVHDYPWFCQRVSLVGVHDRYCGEPEPPACEACVADSGRVMEEAIDVTAMLQRSAEFLAAARQVVTPSEDTAIRMRRHFSGLRPVVVPHEDDRVLPEPGVPQARNGRCRVCVVGAIGVHKGFDVLLACGRDAAQRNLPLDFVLVGTSIDDARLLATGRIFVTGRYRPADAVPMIQQQNASLALLPSIWPETWCLALTELWRAGLRVAAFDLGAPAERIRRNGWGILLPPGLSPRAMNNVLLASVGLARQER